MEGRRRSPAAVLFDLNGTLTDPIVERLRAPLRAPVSALLGVDDAAFGEELRDTYPARAIGQPGGTRAALGEILARLGAQPAEAAIDRAVALRLAHFRRFLQPRAGALALLRDLRARGFRTAVVSDCTSETPEVWPTLPYRELVEAAIFSCAVGVRKPAAPIYLAACRRLGVRPADCLFVGDGGSHELTGAAALGMRAVLLRNPETPDHAAHRIDVDSAWRGPEIHRLAEVLRLMRSVDPGV